MSTNYTESKFESEIFLFFQSVEMGSLSIPQTLLQKGFDVNKRTDNKNTALHISCKNNFNDLILLLLSFGANPNLINDDGITPLMLAIMNGDEMIITSILRNSKYIDLNIKSNEMKTAIEYTNNPNIISLIKLYINNKEDFFNFHKKSSMILPSTNIQKVQHVINKSKSSSNIISDIKLNKSFLIQVNNFEDKLDKLKREIMNTSSISKSDISNINNNDDSITNGLKTISNNNIFQYRISSKLNSNNTINSFLPNRIILDNNIPINTNKLNTINKFTFGSKNENITLNDYTKNLNLVNNNLSQKSNNNKKDFYNEEFANKNSFNYAQNQDKIKIFQNKNDELINIKNNKKFNEITSYNLPLQLSNRNMNLEYKKDNMKIYFIQSKLPIITFYSIKNDIIINKKESISICNKYNSNFYSCKYEEKYNENINNINHLNNKSAIIKSNKEKFKISNMKNLFSIKKNETKNSYKQLNENENFDKDFFTSNPCQTSTNSTNFIENQENYSNYKKFLNNKNKNIYYFLRDINLQQYFPLFIQNGYDDLDLILNEVKIYDGCPINNNDLRLIGIINPGDRAKILIRLEEISNCFSFNIPEDIYREKKIIDNSIINRINQLKIWLSSINLDNLLDNFLMCGFFNLDLLIIQNLTKSPLTENDLKVEFNIEKQGYRTRIIAKIKHDSKKKYIDSKNETEPIIYHNQKEESTCKCQIF